MKFITTLIFSLISISVFSQGLGVNKAVPASRLHIYDNTSTAGVTIGLTVEQDGTGDAVLQWLLSGGQRYVAGIDNSDGDKFKIASTEDLNTNALFVLDPAGGVLTNVLSKGQMNFTDSAYTITITGIDPITNDGNDLFSSFDDTGDVTIAGDSAVVSIGWVTIAGFVSVSGTAVYKVGLEINGTPVDNYGAHTAIAGDTRTWPIHYAYNNASGNDIIKPTIEVISGVDTTPELVGGSITVDVE